MANRWLIVKCPKSLGLWVLDSNPPGNPPEDLEEWQEEILTRLAGCFQVGISCALFGSTLVNIAYTYIYCILYIYICIYIYMYVSNHVKRI